MSRRESRKYIDPNNHPTGRRDLILHACEHISGKILAPAAAIKMISAALDPTHTGKNALHHESALVHKYVGNSLNEIPLVHRSFATYPIAIYRGRLFC